MIDRALVDFQGEASKLPECPCHGVTVLPHNGMPFVKLDCGILSSTLWFERTARELFITALLMAEPFQTSEPMPQISSDSLDFTGWSVPPGWYGFVHAANIGIIHRACLDVTDETRAALASLGQPESGSRSQEFEGRRLVRVDGGFIVLNFIKYRDKDATTAERSRRWRERQRLALATRVTDTPTRVIRHADKREEKKGIQRKEEKTEAEAEAEAEVSKKDPTDLLIKTEQAQSNYTSAHADFVRFYEAYPVSRRITGTKGKAAFRRAVHNGHGISLTKLLAALEQQKRSVQWQTPGLIPSMVVWLNQERWNQVLPEVRQSQPVGAWCSHNPKCVSPDWHQVVLAREKGES